MKSNQLTKVRDNESVFSRKINSPWLNTFLILQVLLDSDIHVAILHFWQSVTTYNEIWWKRAIVVPHLLPFLVKEFLVYSFSIWLTGSNSQFLYIFMFADIPAGKNVWISF